MTSANPGDGAKGVLLVGHGTRDAEGRAEFMVATQRVAELCPDQVVEPCFLEMADPPIAVGFERLVSRGVRRITVMPLLLFAAGHAKRDIPGALSAAAARHPDVDVTQVEPLGCHRRIVELSAERFRETVEKFAQFRPNDCLLLLVGRGSNDDEATREMHRFAQLRAEQTPVGRVEVCFAAMAQPLLSTAMEHAAAVGYPLVVVQPHLLFGGQLLVNLQHNVAAFARQQPQQQWMITEHLGPSMLLAEAVADRIRQAGAGVHANN